MKLDRKTFIRSLGIGTLSTLAVPAVAGSSRTSSVTYPKFDEREPATFWRDIRRLYLVQDDPLYLNTGGLGPTLQPALDAMVSTMERLQEHSETGHDRFDPARETVAKFLGASPDELCFTRNATEANSIIAAGLNLAPATK